MFLDVAGAEDSASPAESLLVDCNGGSASIITDSRYLSLCDEISLSAESLDVFLDVKK